MHTLVQDIRLAWRRLRRAPAISIGYVVVLAIAMGVNLAVLSMLSALHFRSLPIKEPGSLLSATSYDAAGRARYIPFPIVHELQRQGPFSVVCGYSGGAILAFEVRQMSTQAAVAFVSGQCFETFGITPILGRGFVETDAPLVSAGNRVVVISHSFWTRAYGRDPRAIGESIRTDGVSAMVVGVLPEGFGGLHVDTGIDVYAPPDTLLPSPADRRPVAGQILGRLRPGTTLAQASAELAARWPSLLTESMSATPNPSEGADLFGPALRLESMRTGISTYRVRYSPALQVVFVLTLILLLLVCINLGGLLSAKATRSAAELSIHYSLGGSRQRLARQFLAESLLLALCGTMLAAPVCLAIIAILSGLLPPGIIPTSVSFLPDLNVWLFGLGGGILMGLLIGIVPVIVMARRVQLTGADTGRTVVNNRGFSSAALLVVQVALSVVLVFGAGLLARSLTQLQHTNLGFEPSRLLNVRLMSLPDGRRASDAREYYQRVVEAVAATPGVTGVALSQIFPRWTLEPTTAVAFSNDQLGDIRAVADTVTPDFFDTVGIPIVAGRPFTWTDGADGRSVAMVTAGLARQLVPGGDVVGREIKYGTGKDMQHLVIVGIAGDVSSGNPRRSDMPMVYLPLGTRVYNAPNLLVSSTDANLSALGSSIRRILATEGREYAHEVIPVDALFARASASERMSVVMSLAVGVVALAVATLGIFVAISYAVERRRREMGVRLAIGASPRQLAFAVAGDAYRVIVAGMLLGVPVALMASQWLGTLLFKVRPFDAVTLIGTAAVFCLVGLIASLAPALRAANLDPVIALRSD